MKPGSRSTSRRTRALVGAVAVAATVPLVLAGCSGSGNASSSGGGGKTLTIEDYYDANYDPVYQQCAKDVGVEVKINHVAGAGLISKVLQQASSRTLPDVLMLDNPDVQQIASSGALSDLSDYGLDADDDVPGVKGANTFEGKLYGLQPNTNSIALYYNKKLLADAGVQPPKTWDELKTAAKTLTKGSTYGFAMSNINTYEGTWQFLPFFWSNGGDEKDIATPEAAQALQLVQDLQADGSMSKSSINWAQADVNNQFIAGKAAMMINGPWQLPALKKAKDLQFDSVPIPTRTGSETVAPLAARRSPSRRPATRTRCSSPASSSGASTATRCRPSWPASAATCRPTSRSARPGRRTTPTSPRSSPRCRPPAPAPASSARTGPRPPRRSTPPSSSR